MKFNKFFLGLLSAILIFAVTIPNTYANETAVDDRVLTVTYHRMHDENDTTTHQVTYRLGEIIAGKDLDSNWSWNGNEPEDRWTWEENGVKRFSAWNTKKDLTGKWIHGGHIVTEKDLDQVNIDLYEYWVSGLELLGSLSRMQDDTQVKPNIFLEQGEHENINDAYVVDKSDILNYKAELNYKYIERDLVTLWGRMDKTISWKGRLQAEIDSRLDFEDKVNVVFRSTWLKPDYEKLQEYGVESVTDIGDSKWMFTVSKDFITNNKITEEELDTQTNRKYSFYKMIIPVTLIPKEEFIRLSFDGKDYDGSQSITPFFMEPMTLSVAENYEEGLNTIITQDSFNAIATSDNPFVKTKGEIYIEIVGKIPLPPPHDIHKFYLEPKANPEYAKFYPTGKVTYNYFDIENQTKALKDSKDRKSVNLFGRSLNSAVDVNDPQNYSEDFNISPPATTVDDKNNTYRFVKVKDGQSLTGTFDFKENKVVDLLYVRNNKGVVIVDHVDEQGNKLKDREVIIDNLNSSYTTAPEHFDKLYFKEVSKESSPVKGLVEKELKHVIYVYTKTKPTVEPKPTPEPTPTPNTGKEKPNNKVILVPKTPKIELAKTGLNNLLLGIFGLTTLLGIGLVSIGYLRKRS